MRTLAQIREASSNSQFKLLFTGMEESPVKMDKEFMIREQEIFINIIKPNNKRIMNRYIKEMDKLDELKKCNICGERECGTSEGIVRSTVNNDEYVREIKVNINVCNDCVKVLVGN